MQPIEKKNPIEIKTKIFADPRSKPYIVYSAIVISHGAWP